MAAVGPFDLNLRHLSALRAVREHGSVIAAAEAVNLSQPALTHGIAKLERQLGCALFERRSQGMVATPAGEMVQDRVDAAMMHLAAGLQGTQTAQPERRITMTQLRGFLALVSAGGFASASEATGLSPTAVHRAVRDLETGIGRQIVERRGRGVVLNAAGQRFARGCRLAIGEVGAIVDELGLAPEGSSIAVGALPLARPFLVPEAMAKMVAQADRLPAGFRIFEGSWSELAEELRDGLIDLVVGELPPHELSDLAQTPLCHDPLVIAAGVQHPLVGRPAPTLATLGRYPWIIGPAGSPLRSEWERLFAGRSLPAAPIECGSMMIIGRLLTSADYLTVLAPDQVALQIRSGLLARIGPPIEGRIRMGIITRRSWRPTAAQRRFIDLLREVADGIGAAESKAATIVGEWV